MSYHNNFVAQTLEMKCKRPNVIFHPTQARIKEVTNHGNAETSPLQLMRLRH
jgi:hypothetical protein